MVEWSPHVLHLNIIRPVFVGFSVARTLANEERLE